MGVNGEDDQNLDSMEIGSTRPEYASTMPDYINYIVAGIGSLYIRGCRIETHIFHGEKI